MEQLTVKEITYYHDGESPKVEEVSLWHGHKPFAFIDDPNVKYIVVGNRVLRTQEEYNAFFHGVEHVRDILVSLANR